MANERFLATALPYSLDATSPFQVSVVITPRLEPDSPASELGKFTTFEHWTDAIAGASVVLRDQAGEVEGVAVVDRREPGLWERVFPAKTPVETVKPAAVDGRDWHTYSVAAAVETVEHFHLATVLASPTETPAPVKSPLLRGLLAILQERDMGFVGGRGEGTWRYDEGHIARFLDEFLDRAREGNLTARSMHAAAPHENTMASVVMRGALYLHAARRFYDRRDPRAGYLRDPDSTFERPRIDRPEPDFHDRCVYLGNQPVLLRRLGLTVDLQVPDVARLAASEWLAAEITVPTPEGAPIVGAATRTACAKVAGRWVVAARGDDWNAGRLRLGDTDKYRVVDLDADGAALKHDRYLWTLPRLLRSSIPRDFAAAMAAAQSGKQPLGPPVDAATPAVRSPGFTVARNRRLDDLRSNIAASQHVGDLLSGQAAPLKAEDLTRGVRVEVWDATERQWFSLHARHGVVTGGDGTALGEFDDEGWVQGTAAASGSDDDDTTLRVHESVFGWDGWSLSAPRPGRTIPLEPEPGRNTAPREPELDHAVMPITDMTVQPFTLPRLRYGREYAFRAWAVDLAGNSVPHTLEDPLSEGPTASVLRSVEAHVTSAKEPAAVIGPDLGDALRGEVTRTLHGEHALGETIPAAVLGARHVASAAPAVLERLPELRRVANLRTSIRRAGSAGTATNPLRGEVVRRAVLRALEEENPSIVSRVATRWDPTRLAEIVGAARQPDRDVGEVVADVTDTVTVPRPFLRWDPVLAPVAVPRREYTEGESLQRLVIRSGVNAVDGGPAGMTIAIVPPADFAAATSATPAYHATCERHLAPPKTSQLTAELHGKFDSAIGSSDPDVHRRMLGWALRESGTFLSKKIAALDDPGKTIDQPGVALVATPGTPKSTLVELDSVQTGDPVAPGQYVVHDVDAVTLPYLPDPLAVGLTLWFIDAGLDRRLHFPHGAETLTLRYDGEWPALDPLRLVVESGDALTARLEANVLTIAMPPGDTLRFRLSTALEREALNLLGVWRAIPDAIRGDIDVAEAASDGLLWSLTPSEEYVLVHAVPRPIEAPRPTRLAPERERDATVVWVRGGVDCHGPSTGRLDCEASWTEWVDDLTLPELEKRPTSGLAFTTDIDPEEDIVVLDGSDDHFENVPGAGVVRLHASAHHLGDTRHRMIDYRFRAHTRFQEYFPPALLDGEQGRGVVGPLRRISVPSSARPPAPVVDSVIPLFRWEHGGEPEQPAAVRSTRRSGLRVYLQRPWFASGEGELLGVIVAPEGDETNLEGSVTSWGADPVWRQKGPERRPMLAELDDFLHLTGYDDRPRAGRPVRLGEGLRLLDSRGEPEVHVLGYEPWFNKQRGLWAVDIAIDAGSAFWPFVRLAVARYQPESVDGCHLSDVVVCDFAQLAPERAATVGRPDLRHVRVVVSGPAGMRQPLERDVERRRTAVPEAALRRRIIAHVQRRDPGIPTDLGWQTVATQTLELRGFDSDEWEAAWVGEIELPEDVPLRTPGTSADWRVAVEEVELMDADPVDGQEPPYYEARLVYADHLPL